MEEIGKPAQNFSKDKEWRKSYMEWEQYRLNLILKSEAKGREEGREEARAEGMNTLFNRLQKLGIGREQALKCVCEEYPQYSCKEIRKILSA